MNLIKKKRNKFCFDLNKKVIIRVTKTNNETEHLGMCLGIDHISGYFSYHNSVLAHHFISVQSPWFISSNKVAVFVIRSKANTCDFTWFHHLNICCERDCSAVSFGWLVSVSAWSHKPYDFHFLFSLILLLVVDQVF